MADMTRIKGRIQEVIRPNGVGAITAAEHQSLLLEMVDDINNKKADQSELITTKESLNALEQKVDNLPQGDYDDTELKEQIAELQRNKIDKHNDDYYPTMAVGLADNLSGVDVVDSEVNFRRSGGGAISDGVARIEAIKGNSVVWNQLRSSANRISLESSKGGISIQYNIGDILQNITGTYEGFDGDPNWYNPGAFNAIKGVIGHKYLCSIKGNKNTLMTVYGYGGPSIRSIKDSVIIVAETATNINIAPCIDRSMAIGTVVNENILFLCHDLTQMFGAGNEPTTIEDFYARIPMGVDLNAYNEGEVIHMDVQSIESQGVNAWDEEWEVGTISEVDGENIASTAIIRSKGYIKVLPNEKYFLPILLTQKYQQGSTGYFFVYYYDGDYEYIGKYKTYSNWPSESSWLINTPSNCQYIRFATNIEGATYNHDICINLSDTSINGKYIPYIKRVEDLSIIRKYFPQGMKSAGTAHDEVYYDKTTNKKFAVQRMGQVNAWELIWNYMGISESNPYGRFSTAVSGRQINQGNILCTIYTTQGASYTTDKNIFGAGSANTIIVIDSAYTDVASFTAMLQEKKVVLYYELAEPIVTELDAEDQFKDLDYQVWNCGTEKAIAEGKSAPLAADITYGFNAVGMIREHEIEITELQKVIATMQAQLTSLINGGQ